MEKKKYMKKKWETRDDGGIKKQKALHSGVGSGRIEGGERTGRRGGSCLWAARRERRRQRGDGSEKPGGQREAALAAVQEKRNREEALASRTESKNLPLGSKGISTENQEKNCAVREIESRTCGAPIHSLSVKSFQTSILFLF
ncbi:hypothetical protein ACFX11_020182 [Malus domestica]